MSDPAADLELIVIDQSDADDSERALQPLLADQRLRYVRSATRGKGAALNEGFRLARAAAVVCTDDDCEAPRGWASDMANALEAEPGAAIVFCQVLAVEHDKAQGYVPAYQLQQSRTLRSLRDARNGFGLGAGMAVRRDFLLSVGGFDENFGPGGRFPSADEWDLALRALLMGNHVHETASLHIVHDGFRSFAEGRQHARRDWLALGAVCAKPLRAGHWRAAVVPLWFFPKVALWPPLNDVLHGKKPRGLIRITAFLQGFGQGLRSDVDRGTMRYTKV